MSGDAATIATVDALRQRGVQLTVDDFGTGYSSLLALAPLLIYRSSRSTHSFHQQHHARNPAEARRSSSHHRGGAA